MKTLSMIALAVAALALPTAYAADAAKSKTAAKNDCYEAGTAPQPKSDKSRADVKKEAKGAATECEASKSPEAKSTASRADVKAEAKRAEKAGEIPKGEPMEAKKK